MGDAFIGTVEQGDTFVFVVRSALQYFDVIRNADGTAVMADQPTYLISGKYGNELRRGVVDTTSMNAGEKYTIIVKNEVGLSPASWTTLEFDCSMRYWSRMGVVLERLEWIRNDIENVVFPRLKRALSSLGENMLIDLTEADSAGNITSMRVRFFESKEDCEAATPDIADEALPEPGEIEDLYVTQAYETPRCIRTTHASTVGADAEDSDTTDNQRSDSVAAPGNAGGWPDE